uniref:Putative secreted protein n=1 Tax=Anopheles darlingi TaxID=43151 RepID=A0A2M4DJ18_ANODA
MLVVVMELLLPLWEGIRQVSVSTLAVRRRNAVPYRIHDRLRLKCLPAVSVTGNHHHRLYRILRRSLPKNRSAARMTWRLLRS